MQHRMIVTGATKRSTLAHTYKRIVGATSKKLCAAIRRSLIEDVEEERASERRLPLAGLSRDNSQCRVYIAGRSGTFSIFTRNFLSSRTSKLPSLCFLIDGPSRGGSTFYTIIRREASASGLFPREITAFLTPVSGTAGGIADSEAGTPRNAGERGAIVAPETEHLPWASLFLISFEDASRFVREAVDANRQD